MKNKRRSAFTIVELVIVIAVIAILSAVLIPTFGAIIKDANVAADNTAASTLTSELHVYLKGNTIDSEEELVEALDKSGVGKKLVPKALTYGYHFWFDMENQMFTAKTAEEIEDARAPYSGSSASGMRNIYNNGYFLADSDDVIVNMFGNMADIDADNYDDYFATVKNAINDDNYGAIAEKVLENLQKTIIVNDNGIFFYTANARALSENSVWFAPGIKVVNADHYAFDGSEVKAATTLPGVVGNAVQLPSSVLLVEEDALDFGDGNAVVIKTNLSNGDAIASVFAPLSTDATIADKSGNEYKVTRVDNPTDGHEADRLVLASDSSWVADLIVRLPFADFEIGYTTEDDLVEFNTDTLYVSYLQSGKVVLFAKDTASDATSLGVHTWISDNPAISVEGGVLSFDGDAIIAGSHRATITAYAKNVYGEDCEPKTLKVEVRIAESATVEINGYTYKLEEDASHHLSYYADSTTQSIKLDNLSVGWKIGAVGEDLYNLRAGELKITKGDTTTTNGEISFGDNDTEYTFTVSVDDRLTTTFTVAIINLEKSPFKTKFHHSRNHSPYYIGSGDSIKLSDIFYTDEDFTFEGATLTVYGWVEKGTDIFPTYEINNYAPDGKAIWTDEYTRDITSNWKDVAIQFNTDSTYDHTDEEGAIADYNVVIEIAPKNGIAMVAHVVIVRDAKNINSVDALNGTHNNSIVLHNDVTIGTGKQVTLNNSTFYGNGYVISATGYQSNAAQDKLDSALITLNDSSAENIFVNGPVYAILDYTNNANKNYVSGVRVTGEGTISDSYISGFRQPVMSAGNKLNVVNSTLEGGNMANLYLETGDLYLEDVTTVQKVDGYQTTVGDSKKVIGAGIYIGKENVDAEITVVGYLDQYNWIKNQQDGPSMPTVYENNKEFDLGELFGFIFNGIDITFIAHIKADIGSVKYYINQNDDGTAEYVHAGIVFYGMGDTAAMDTLAGQITISINEDDRTDGSIKKRTFDLLDMRFSKMGVGDYITGAQYFQTDGIVKIWSHKDNRQWVAQDIQLGTEGSGCNTVVTVTRPVVPTGTLVDADKPLYTIDNADYPINYTGYDYTK